MITIRSQEISDAERFYEILNNPNFLFFPSRPASVESERAWLAENSVPNGKNYVWNYTILKNGEVVGGMGIKVDYHRKYIGEIGYFLDEKYWNQGITTAAVKLLEKIAYEELEMTRLIIIMEKENKASEKVAIKNNYILEGEMKKVVRDPDGKMCDCLLYAKVL